MTGAPRHGDGPGWPPAPTLRERIEAEVREAERLHLDADELNRRIWAELADTEDRVRHIRWLREREDGGDGDR
jgi:hypothetical protein